jgi:alkanesulfonate monooxygenase SsuD/methylene tetrahydromethanopterin reductase-like flavin-dependent oxidoreductase (luciferase family)
MLQLGVFDHLDHNGASLGEQLEDRLKLIGILDAEGYYAYHVAEHHSTRLGMAPSPSTFLAAVAQRTRRIRFGPLVYVLPLHHPLRLYEEICMLDHLSGGRFQLGVGRGGALLEHQRYGIEPATAQAMYHEAFTVLMRACETEVLNFEGQFYRFKDYLAVAKPLQRPHPPLWYGIPNVDAVSWAVSRSVNVISLGPASRARNISSRYRDDWAAAGRVSRDLPMIGISRHIVVAETDAEARRIADQAYRPWREALEFLFERSRLAFPLAEYYPLSFEELATIGHGIAGSPGHCAQLSSGAHARNQSELLSVPHDLRHNAVRGGRDVGAAVRPERHAGIATCSWNMRLRHSRTRAMGIEGLPYRGLLSRG